MSVYHWAELALEVGFPIVAAGVLWLSILQAVRVAWKEVIRPSLLVNLDQLKAITRQLTRLADALEANTRQLTRLADALERIADSPRSAPRRKGDA